MPSVLIYSDHQSPRLHYILELMLGRLLGLSYRLTADRRSYLSHSGPVINYSKEALRKEELHIIPHPLLFEKGIKNQAIVVEQWQNMPVFFKTGASAFDLFAAGFYLLSRYEEYLPYESDAHGRFPGKASLAYRAQFLEIPIIHRYEAFLKAAIRRQSPKVVFAERRYRFLPTIDVDAAWAYRYKGVLRLFLGSLSDLLKSRHLEFRKRLEVLFAKVPDPFDTYAFLEQTHQDHPASLHYFFLLGTYGTYDKNHAPGHPAFQTLIRKIAAAHPIGIHPSYRSNESPERLQQEIQQLSVITGQSIRHSRQHFLKLHLPETYRNLLEQGIQYDYSMGYADLPGFRAGIAVPFQWYDLAREAATALEIIPFQLMDVTLRQHMGLSEPTARARCQALLQEVRAVQGVFSVIWHNSSLSDWNEWKGWRTFYAWLVDAAQRESRPKEL